MKIRTWTDHRYNETIFQVNITDREIEELDRAMIRPIGYEGSISEILLMLAMAARLLETREVERMAQEIQALELPSG